jgi:hypothetical protein
MIELEKQLNNLPKPKLGLRADLKIRFRIYKLIIKRDLEGLCAAWLPKRSGYAPLAALFLLFTIIVAVPSYAYASDKVTLNHPLYPIKRSLEDVQLSLSFTSEQKAETYSKLAERRLDEANVLSNEGKTEKTEVALANTVKEAMRLEENADAQTALVTAGSKQEALKVEIRNTAEAQIAKLKDVAKNVGVKAREDTMDSIAMSLDALSDDIKDRASNVIKKKDEVLIQPLFSTASSSNENPENDVREKRNATSSSRSIFDQTKAEANLDEIKAKVENLRAELDSNSFEQSDVKALFDRLDNKVERAQDAINEDQKANFQGLLQSAQALTNNAKHFIKEKAHATSTSSIDSEAGNQETKNASTNTDEQASKNTIDTGEPNGHSYGNNNKEK